MIFPWTKLKRENDILSTDLAMVRANLYATHRSLGEAVDLAYARKQALHAIAAEERPTSNATVKRMARMAREALK
jgi:hypothetical protein